LHADRSLDVGNFYLKKGEYDAAIDRFEEAAHYNPKAAKPYLLLGETYEKKSDSADAITAYRKYLELFQNAPDRDKVLHRIEKLEGKSEHDPAHSGSE
jgi:Flp pilus assembly protein TadD